MAAMPNSPGHLEKMVVPTLKPTEASTVTWFRGFEATMAGIPNREVSHNACKLFDQSAIVLALVLARKMK